MEVVDIVDLVEKHYGDKNTLIKDLLPYFHLVDRLVEKIEVLQKDLADISRKLDKKNDKKTWRMKMKNYIETKGRKGHLN